ncbi:MAG: hypothetical protein AABZ09_08560, partial [Candidatus Binatota bacterium]
MGKVDVGFSVTLPRQGEDRVGTRFYISVDRAREMDAQKGEARVRDGVDESPDQVTLFGFLVNCAVAY